MKTRGELRFFSHDAHVHAVVDNVVACGMSAIDALTSLHFLVRDEPPTSVGALCPKCCAALERDGLTIVYPTRLRAPTLDLLVALDDGKDSSVGCHTRSDYGGRTRAILALRKRLLIDSDWRPTKAGKLAADAHRQRRSRT